MIRPTTCLHLLLHYQDCPRPQAVTRYVASDTPTAAQQARRLARRRGVERVVVAPCDCRPVPPLSRAGGLMGEAR